MQNEWILILSISFNFVHFVRCPRLFTKKWTKLKPWSKKIKNCFVKAGFPDSHNEIYETDNDGTVILDEEDWKSLQTGISSKNL